jgi:hypothetical protein
MLHKEKDLDTAIADFKSFLETHADRDILFSSESLFFRLREEWMHEDLLRLFATAQQVAPVTCVWTVRRVDDMVRSLYRQLTAAGVELTPPPQLAEEFQPDPLLDGFRKVDDLVATVVYFKYDHAGSHNAELLRAFGVSAELAGVIERDLRAAPRLNTSLSQKQAAAVLNLESLSARTGARLDKAALLKAFRHGDFRFDDDRPWALMDDGVSRSLHQRMLESSLKNGFEPYPRFFGNVVVGSESSTPTPDSDLLSDGDLNKLASELSVTQ